ncbi:MAG: hypothetical protein P8Y45_19635, partial [Exilibacterium sp.]
EDTDMDNEASNLFFDYAILITSLVYITAIVGLSYQLDNKSEWVSKVINKLLLSIGAISKQDEYLSSNG